MLRDICTRLDGLPLAIELAAAWLRSMPLSELATGLDDRFRLLSRGPRNARPRQQTLRAVVDWSYNLLFDDERRVLDRLSVFAGGCTIAAARVVCSDDDITPDDVTDLVTRLAEKSLVSLVQDGGSGTRFRMLQTLVEYGRHVSPPRARRHVRVQAHARDFTEFALENSAALRCERQRSWLRIISAEIENLRAALDAPVARDDADTASALVGALGGTGGSPVACGEGGRWLRLAMGCSGRTRARHQSRLLAWAAFLRAPGFVAWGDADDRFGVQLGRLGAGRSNGSTGFGCRHETWSSSPTESTNGLESKPRLLLPSRRLEIRLEFVSCSSTR